MNLNFFNTNNLNDSVHHLFDKVLNFPINAKRIESINIEEYFQIYKREDYYFISYIESIYFSGLVNDECFDTNKKSISIFDTDNEQTDKDKDKYKTLLIFSIKLKSKGDKSYTRTVLADISRAINRFNNGTPTIIVFNYDNYISITGVERTEYKRKTGEKLGKVSMLKDINIEKPHTGHLKILDELKLKSDVRTFDALYKQWREVFDVQVLNKKFYQEIYRWYEWAVKNVKFPNDINDDYDDEKYNSENIIRLLTRIIFIWFLKEKNLVPDLLFKESELVKIIKDFNDKNSTNYYSAILQNLFFAALNQKINERKFASEGDFKKQKQHYGVKTLFRYADLFLIETESVLNMFEKVPFVNGGLFDCLDNDEPVKVLENGKVKQKVFYFDGFSRNPNKKAIVPNILFFNDEDTNNTKLKVTSNGEKGLINILNSYKFTVAENTPIEEEIALDPELLGRIFENLLASYNEESKTTARKATGSFYTPREIVNYMVDESLIAYLEKKLKDEIAQTSTTVENENQQKLRQLLSYSDESHQFNQAEVEIIIKSIDEMKILDPACGSGAFPMGILQKLVYVLHKLDPDNTIWLKIQRENIIKPKIEELKKDKDIIKNLRDDEIRMKAEQALEDRLNEINDAFNREFNYDDYARKLFLIENCIYGVDIQTIAIQISKLRCFISLIIDQKGKLDKSDNHGIKALPNLETKFVAANTLIALDMPEQLSMRNPEIEIVEKAIIENRHNYFTVSTRTEKLALQEKDMQLRKKLSVLLKADGWKNITAEQISDWDPFNQNSSSSWFVPEWMFGIKDGFDIVIGNPPYIQLQKDGGNLAKQFEKMNYQTFAKTGDIYALFYEKGINLLKNDGNLIFITSNKWMRAGYGEKLREFFTRYDSKILIDLGPGVFESATVDTNILLIKKNINSNNLRAVTINANSKGSIDINSIIENDGVIINKLTKDAWTISGDIEMRIKEKIERIGTKLKDWDLKIYSGLKAGFNEAFIIEGKKRDELIAQDPKSADIIKPLLRGRDIKRYKAEFADLWIINSHNGIKEKGIPRIDIPKNYPAIYKHLKKYEKELIKRQDKGDHWTNLRNCAYVEDFEKDNICLTKASKEQSFYLNNSPIKYYLLNTSYFIIHKSSNIYLISVLNSKLARYAFLNYYQSGGIDGEITIQGIIELPIPKISLKEQQPFIDLVNIILKKKENNEDTTLEEKKIDLMVYKLYDLTEEEIAIIEKNETK